MKQLLVIIVLSVTSYNIFSEDFNKERAYNYLLEQCAFGTREPGSSGHKQMKTYIERFFKSKKGFYSRDNFSSHSAMQKKTFQLSNFHIVFAGLSKKRVILCAHWDTRPWADRDPDRSKHKLPIAGANDGASGVAVLMEMCNIIPKLKLLNSIEIILFDGEDSGDYGGKEWCIGSAHFAKFANPSKYRYGVLIDMIGDKDLEVNMEKNSLKSAPFLLQTIFKIAEDLNINNFVNKVGLEIYDDHVPLINKGIPMVDLIDFNYPYWHTMEDTPDKCSQESLDKIGRILVKLISTEY